MRWLCSGCLIICPALLASASLCISIHCYFHYFYFSVGFVQTLHISFREFTVKRCKEREIVVLVILAFANLLYIINFIFTKFVFNIMLFLI